MIPLIVKIECETTKTADGKTNHLIWAVDSAGRELHYDESGLYYEIKKMKLGKPYSWDTVSDKKAYIRHIQPYIDRYNNDAKRHNKANTVLSKTKTTIKV